jgi:molybdopterin-guanine dinucleotide biosynthesis protein A
MPFIDGDVVWIMWASRGKGTQVVAARIDGYLEPLHALYRADCGSIAEAALDRGERKVKCFYPQVQLRIVEEKELRELKGFRESFSNLNTPRDLERLHRQELRFLPAAEAVVPESPGDGEWVLCRRLRRSAPSGSSAP